MYDVSGDFGSKSSGFGPARTAGGALRLGVAGDRLDVRLEDHARLVEELLALEDAAPSSWKAHTGLSEHAYCFALQQPPIVCTAGKTIVSDVSLTGDESPISRRASGSPRVSIVPRRARQRLERRVALPVHVLLRADQLLRRGTQ